MGRHTTPGEPPQREAAGTMIRRRTVDAGLLSALLLFAELSFVREGTGPLAALPELFAADGWRPALPAVAALVAAALVAAGLLCRRGVLPSPLRAGLAAGAGVAGFAFLYGWCADDALRALPMVAGCHCWVAGIAGALAALAVGALATLLHACVARAVAFVAAAAALGERSRADAVAHRARFAHRATPGRVAAPPARHGALRAPPLTA